MKKEQQCSLVKDLMPNYIEGLTSEYTEEFVRNHLTECVSCQKIYQLLNKVEDVEVKERMEEAKQLKWYLKKVKLINLVLGLMLGVLVLYGALVSYNYLFVQTNHIVRSEKIAVTDLYELENGYIYFTLKSSEPYLINFASVTTDLLNIKQEFSASDITFKRSIIGQKPKTENGDLDENYDYSESFILDPKTGRVEFYNLSEKLGITEIDDLIEIIFTEETANTNNPINEIYYIGNTENDKLLIWKEGMELPSYPY